MTPSARYEPSDRYPQKPVRLVVAGASALTPPSVRRLTPAQAEALAADLLAAARQARGNVYPPAVEVSPGVIEVGGPDKQHEAA